MGKILLPSVIGQDWVCDHTCPTNILATPLLKYNKDQATTVKGGSQSRIRLDQDMFSLEFDPVTAKDQGKYLCLINNRPLPDAVIHLNILGKTSILGYLSG